MNGFSKLSIISFLMLLLVGAVYFNSQVQFNSVSARWEINEDYQITDEQLIDIQQDVYYLSFDGINDYVEIPNSNHFELTDEWSLTFKLLHNGSNVRQSIYGDGNGSGSRYLFLQINPDNSFTYLLGNGDWVSVFPNTGITLNTNTIYEITLTSDGSNTYIYIDGVLEYTDNNSVIIPDSNIIPNFGRDPQDQDDWLNGNIYNVQMWTKTLNGTEINNYITNKPTGNESNLVHYYNFSEGSGTTLGDSVVNNDGTIYGALWVQSGTAITQITQPAVDSYQVFENIRNNAPTSNPLGFMDTIITIPQKMVTYTDTFFSWIGFSYKENILEPAAEVSSNLADDFKWYSDLFNWVRGFGE